DRDAMAAVAREFDGYITDMLDTRRQAGDHAPNDVTTSLMREQVNGKPMTDDELVSLMRNWTVGELATISASVSILLNYLARRSGRPGCSSPGIRRLHYRHAGYPPPGWRPCTE